MKINKIALLTLITLFTLTDAKMVDGIACVVEGEAVTIAEIQAIQRQFHLSKQEATDLLIKDRLQKSALKDIQIEESAVDKKIAEIAAQNKLTIPKMQKILKQQGTPWSKYRKNVRMALKKEKFYQDKVINTIPQPSEEELKLFYTHHKKAFFVPSRVRLVEYSTPSENRMKQFLQTKNTKGIQSRTLQKTTKALNPSLLATILQTQNGHYTRPLNAGDKYISYKVVSKEGKRFLSFDEAHTAVEMQWRQQQQNKALKDYFEKLKTNADIQYIRR